VNETSDKQADFTTFFSTHLIRLCWYEGPCNSNGEFTKTPEYRCASGFLLKLYDEICLVTAGHVLKDIEPRLQKNRHSAKFFGLFDVWGPKSVVERRIPFDFSDADTFVCEFEPDLGIDVAVVLLPTIYQEMLLQTITPFGDEQWNKQEGLEFDFYAILGIPSALAEQEISRNSVTTFASPRVIFLMKDEVEANKPATALPQFHGKILPGDPIDDIAGVSGGPILGFRKCSDGKLRYWPIAIQSRWKPKSRTVTGTSLRHFASSLYAFVESHNSDEGS
jgi:hypothetical protein